MSIRAQGDNLLLTQIENRQSDFDVSSEGSSGTTYLVAHAGTDSNYKDGDVVVVLQPVVIAVEGVTYYLAQDEDVIAVMENQ